MAEEKVENRKFREIPWRYALVVVLVLAASAISLVFCHFSGAGRSSSQWVPLFGGKLFTESERIQIEMAFADAQLCDYVIEDGLVRVPNCHKNAFILALKKARLFDEETEKARSSSGFWLSDRERQAEALREKQSELAGQLRTFHGIESARVLLDVSETKTGFTREKHATASISIRSQAGYEISQADIQSVLHLVTGAVCGLKAANVSIVDTRTNRSWHFDAPEVVQPAGNSEVLEDSARNENARSRKIVFQPESLPQPEIYDSAALEMLQARDGTAKNEVASREASAGSLRVRNADFNAAEDPLFVPGRVVIAGGNVVPGKSVMVRASASVSSSEAPRALEDLMQPNGLPESVAAERAMGSSADALRVSEKSVSKEEIREFTNSVQLADKKTSGQRPREVSVFLGVVAALVSFICVFVIFMTRKGLFTANSQRRKVAAAIAKTEPQELADASEFNPAESLLGAGNENSRSGETSETSGAERISGLLETLQHLKREEEVEVPRSDEFQVSVPEMAETAEKTPEIVCESASEPETAVAEPEAMPEKESEIPEMEALLRMAPSRLALAFLEERPQTAAMILKQFPETVRQAVLNGIPSKRRLTIESRLVDCAFPEPEILQEAASAILEHLALLEENSQTAADEKKETPAEKSSSAIFDAQPQARIRPLADVLPQESASAAAKRDFSSGTVEPVPSPAVSTAPARESKNASEEVGDSASGGSRWQFEDLQAFSEADLRIILGSCEPRDAILALIGAEPRLVERMLAVLPKAEAVQVRYQLMHPGRIRLWDVEKARQKILMLVERLAERNRIQPPTPAEVA